MTTETNRSFPDPVDIEELKVLVGWPEGTSGYWTEWNAISQINDLCKKLGYGRIPQMTAALEDIWGHPEKVAEYAEQQKTHLKNISQSSG